MKRWSLTAAGAALITAATVAAVVASGSSAARPTYSTATLSNISFGPANHVQFGYVKGNHYVKLFDNARGTMATSYSIPYAGAGTLVLYIKDISCGRTVYLSNGGGAVDHATITNYTTYGLVDIIDGGAAPNCLSETSVTTPDPGGGTLSARVTPYSALDLAP